MTTIAPPFSYHGGKARLAPTIAEMLTAHRVYVEPFAGSLSVLLAKPRVGIEMVNDLDGDLVNFWRQLRDRPDDLQAALAATPYSRAEYDAAWEPTDDDLERARRFWVRVYQGVAHKLSSKSGWQCGSSDGGGATSKASTVMRKVDGLPVVAARIRSLLVDCRPAVDVIDMMDSPDTLHYCDPPYVNSTHTGGESAYIHTMTDRQHIELAETLHACEGTVVLSGYPSDLYRNLYADWHAVTLRGRADTANRSGAATVRTEVLWSNRPLGRLQPTLLDEECD